MVPSNVYSHDQAIDMTVTGYVCALSSDTVIASMSEKAIEAQHIE